MSQQQQVYDREKISMSIVRLKKGGEIFEIVLEDPDKALGIRNGDDNIDVSDALKSEHIFKDAKKGEFASEPKINELFSTNDVKEVAKVILREGEFHLTADQRKDLTESKKNQIIDYIHTNAIDPKTNIPHPKMRIELAMKEAGVHIDMHKNVGSQLEEIVKKLRPIIPLSFEEARLNILIPARHAAQAYSVIKSKFEIFNDKWNNDGSVSFELKTPAANKQEIFNTLNSITHGEAQIEEVK